MKNVKIIVLILIGLFVQTLSYGQENKIHVITKSTENSIKLRWAPSNPKTWRLLNEGGVIIERYTISKNGKMVQDTEKTILTKKPIKPLGKEDEKWIEFEEDKFAIIAYGILYNESFSANVSANSSVYQMLEDNKNKEMAFSFFLLSADLSSNASRMAGLFYEDKTALKNTEYLYRIYPKMNSKTNFIDTTIVLTSVSNFEPLKPIDSIEFSLEKKKITLTWDTRLVNYSAYVLEKSENNKDFVSISDAPIVNVQKDNSTTYFYKDSLLEYDKSYYYRIKGIDAFGDESSYSTTLDVIAYEDINTSPKFINVEVVKNKEVELEWEIDEKERNKIKKYAILRAKKSDGNYKLLKDGLSKRKLKYTDREPTGSNYYIIRAYSKNGKFVESFPTLAQLTDDIPPLPPIELKGKIDSNGVVKITWKENKELDLFGYRVFKSNFKDNEYSQITNGAAKEALFYDTVSLASLNKEIYYKIVAIDDHYNPSKFSKALILKKPDTIPPVSALFIAYQANQNGVLLNWINSSSMDVASHVIFRRIKGSENWKLIKTFENKQDSYFDSLQDYRVYDYKIIAKDQGGLESTPKDFLTAKKINTGIINEKPKLEVEVIADQQLFVIKWEVKQKKAKRYILYRAKDEQKLRVYKSFDGKEKGIVDKGIKIGSVYQYRVKAIYEDDTESYISELVKANL